MRRASGAKLSSTERLSPRLNLRRSTRVGAWNVMSLSEVRDKRTSQRDCHLPQLSAELRRLGVSVAALSEVRRPGSGWVSGGGYTYYWSGRPQGHLEGVAVAVADRLVPMITEVTPVNERIMRLRISHTLGVISLVSVYAPTGVSEFSVKEAFYAQLQMVVDSCPKGDTLIVLGDFNATTGTDRDGYQSCVGPHGSGSRDESSSMLLDFAKSRRLRIAGSWFQRPDLHRWTWYSNTGGARKEIDHVLVGGRWRLVQNCRVFRSAEFAGTDHRLLVATLKIRLKSRKMAPSNRVRLDVRRLRDESVAQEYERELAESLGQLNDSDDPEKLWSDFKTKVLKVSKICLRDTSGTS